MIPRRGALHVGGSPAMSLSLVESIVQQIGVTFAHLLPYLIFAGLVFPILTARFACNNTGPW
jgi:hypothetical protein